MARYVYGTQYVDELVRTYRDFNADGEFTDTNETLCYLQDRLYNVVALTDVFGAVQERVFYEPYGRSTCHRISDDDETVGSHFGNPYLFTGRELDSETCFYNYRARYYSPMLCRFLNRDPIGYDAAGCNLYEYVRDNPLTRTDPSGLAPPAVFAQSPIRFRQILELIMGRERERRTAFSRQVDANKALVRPG